MSHRLAVFLRRKALDAYDALIVALGHFAGLAIAAIAVFISAEVVLRNAGAGTIGWLNEAIEYLLYLCTFAAAPWALRQGAHIRVDLLLSALPMRAAMVLERFADASGAIVCAAYCWFGSQTAWVAYRQGTVQYKSFATPEWLLFAVTPVCALLLAVEFVIRYRRASLHDEPLPTGAGP
ncbi:MAG: TRAP transporter small permease [Burkholderiaceae bacterium]|nr:TRAP transporter small permease [Burkholderiaceae bacterium]